MTFRTRLTLVAAVAVAVAVALASVVAYFVVRDQLRAQIDSSLEDRAQSAAFAHVEPDYQTGGLVVDLPGPEFGGAAGLFQGVARTGQTLLSRGATVKLPVTRRADASRSLRTRPWPARTSASTPSSRRSSTASRSRSRGR
jgi:hypothetical protein